MHWYIHIGMTKTGSTFIQNSMFYLRTTLQKYGYDYPDLGKNHSIPLIGLTSDHLLKKFVFFKNIYENTDCMDEIKRLVRKQIESISNSGYHSIVLSGENLCKLDLESVKRLKEELDPKNEDEFSIIVYVRDPIGFVTSTFSETLKHGNLSDIHKIKVEYKEKIEPWIKVFSRDSVDIRIYDSGGFKGDAILRDFFSAINLNADLLDKEKVDLTSVWGNQSLSAEAIECWKELLNQISEKVLEGKTKERRLYRKLFKILAMYKGKKYELPPEIQHKILENNKNQIQWLNKVLGHDAFSIEALNIRSADGDSLDYKPLLVHVLKEFSRTSPAKSKEETFRQHKVLVDSSNFMKKFNKLGNQNIAAK